LLLDLTANPQGNRHFLNDHFLVKKTAEIYHLNPAAFRKKVEEAKVRMRERLTQGRELTAQEKKWFGAEEQGEEEDWWAIADTAELNRALVKSEEEV
jgi:multidrug resistance efflux pump